MTNFLSKLLYTPELLVPQEMPASSSGLLELRQDAIPFNECLGGVFFPGYDKSNKFKNGSDLTPTGVTHPNKGATLATTTQSATEYINLGIKISSFSRNTNSLPGSFLFHFKQLNSDTSEYEGVFQSGSSDGNPPAYFMILKNGTFTFKAGHWSSGYTLSFDINTGVDYHCAIIADDSTWGGRLYVNGKLMDSNSDNMDQAVSYTTHEVGRIFGGVYGYSLFGSMQYFWFYDRRIPESLARNFTLDPYKYMLRPVVPFFFVGSSGSSEGAGSSAGLATVTGVGASIHAVAGASDGVATASGVGEATVAGVGSADGLATVAGVGASVGAGSVGEADGVATVAGVGASTHSVVGSADGVATVLGVGESTHSAVGSADGVATVAGVGATAAAEGAGASDGVATVTGIGASTAAGAGSADGVATVAGVGTTSGAEGAGSAAGVATVVGISVAVSPMVGAADGLAVVAGQGWPVQDVCLPVNAFEVDDSEGFLVTNVDFDFLYVPEPCSGDPVDSNWSEVGAVSDSWTEADGVGNTWSGVCE